jgi:hypothetical protein
LKRKLFSIVAVNFLLICLAFFALFRNNSIWAETSDQKRIGAYYYAWWDMGINNHWLNDDIKGTPFLGNISDPCHYNSSDPTIVNQQILLAMQHGIDFFAVSWAGKGQWLNWDFSVIDYNLRNGFLNASHLREFRFCLFYETVLVLNSSINLGKNFAQIFVEDMNYSLQYLNNPSYLRVDGDPVLFIYSVPYIYQRAQDMNMTVQDVHHLFDYVRKQLADSGLDLYIIGDMGNGLAPPDANSPWLYSLNATTSYHFSDGYESWDEPLRNAETYYPQWLSNSSSRRVGFVPDTYPGSNTTNNKSVQAKDWKVLPRNTTAFKQMVKIALNNTSTTPGFVMVTSWNEWMEGTQIEPSMEEGELFLLAIYDSIPEFSTPLGVTLVILSTLTLVMLRNKVRVAETHGGCQRALGTGSQQSKGGTMLLAHSAV